MPKNPLYEQLMQKMLSERPDLAPFAEMFEKQQAESVDVEDVVKEVEQKHEEQGKRLIAKIRRLEAELDQVLDQNEVLAKALGACDECWGDDKRCPTCRGKGTGGYFLPERELFEKYIKPALDNMPWLSYTVKAH
jgi:hypothetical protein